ncbi:MAG: hypothetical protein R3E01_22295 [Pirellulaceae bacterium]|nr:hypothetical protein [Planctomycetales bacterium]
MTILLDTNILLRLSDRADSKHAVTLHAVEALKLDGRNLGIVPQVLYEYWVVATRPTAANGLGLSVDVATASLNDWKSLFRLYRDERTVFDHWIGIVYDHRVTGRGAHDTRLVAAMRRHGLTELLTFDAGDFLRYGGITVITPESVIGT